jgi:hypothetical protein
MTLALSLLPPHEATGPQWHSDDLERAFASHWLRRFGRYHYGAMMAYLMEGFGLPNVPAGIYDPHKHGHVWALDSGIGFALYVEPKPVEVSAAYVLEHPLRAVELLAFSGTFAFAPTGHLSVVFTDAVLEALCQEFGRLYYTRDVGADAIGTLYTERLRPTLDVGPFDASVRRMER